MPVTEQNPLYSRRTYLRAGTTIALLLGLAGCITDSSTPAKETTTEGENNPDDDSSVTLPAYPAVHFHSARTNDGEAFTYTYDDLPEFRGPAQINERNSGHPDTSNMDVAIEGRGVTLTLHNIATLRDVTIQLWGKTGSDWQNLAEQDITANNPDAEDTSTLQYTEETVEFTGLPATESHVATAYSLIVIDPPSVPDWDTHTPGRILKTARTFAIPYDGPNGRETRIFDGPEVNFESYRGELTPPTIRDNTLVEDHPNGDKTIFVIVNTYGGEYGVATTVSNRVTANQNYSRRDWMRLIKDNGEAEDWSHFATLAEEIQTATKKLGNWDDSLQSKLRVYSQFTASLTYERQNPMRHPTAALLSQDGRNCTEKTLIFNALLQHAPFNYRGEDASYLYCLYDGGAHLVAGINENKFSNPNSDWERYQYSDTFIDKLDAPEDASFIPIDVTNGKFGTLGSDSFANVSVWDNIDGEYVEKV